MQENVSKVYLTKTEQLALCLVACHLDGQDEATKTAALTEPSSPFALKDAILKLKAALPDEAARLTKPELGSLCDAIDYVPRKEMKAVLGSSSRINPLREALLKIQMALYPEDGIPQ